MPWRRISRSASTPILMVLDDVFVVKHIRIGVEALRLIRRHGKSVKHLRFDQLPCDVPCAGHVAGILYAIRGVLT